MRHYLVEMRMSGSIEGVNCHCRSEYEAIQQAQERWPNARVHRVILLD